MKKFLTLFAGLLLCMHTIAALRTADEAMRIAASLDGNNRVARIPARHPQQTLSHCFTALQTSGEPAFYVFNRGEEDGFILISAEDRTHTVLGYADEGSWDATNMSDATRAWIDLYCQSISRVATVPAFASTQAPRYKAKQNKQYTAISPICQTKWGQGNPYNLLCPMYNGSRSVTGCVATAAAQIMKVHAHPTRGTGTSSYKWKSDTGDSITLSVSPGSTTYQWSQMLNSYSSSATTVQKNAVATLMYHCGVVSEMGYTSSASGTSNNKMLAGMVNHFDYDPGVEVLVKDCMKESDFVDGIFSELQQGRPVMFSARTKNDEGHAFVGDGIDADGLVHINWGWNGVCDGYFRVSAMDPDNQGTGGSVSNDAYTVNVLAYTHIRPNNNGSYKYTITSDSVYPYETTVDRAQGYVILRADVFQNLSISTLYGTSSALKVYDANGNFLRYCDYADYSYDGLPPGYYYYSQAVVGDVSNLAVGNYYISPVVKINGTYIPVQVKGFSDYRCPMQITQNYIYLTEPDPDLSEEKQPNEYDYAQIDAYLYPNDCLSSHSWGIQLATADFYQSGSEDQMLLLFSVTSASNRSFAGTFLNDTTSVYRMRGASVLKGNIDSYERTPLDDAEATFAYNSARDSYTVHYYVRMKGKDYFGQAEIPVSNIDAAYGQAYLTHTEYEQITLNHSQYTGITVTQAINRIDAHQVGWASEFPYIVEGEISQLINTPAQMIQYGNCRLYLSDGANSIYGFNTKWLNNQAYPTGNEIAVGGVSAIIGKLKYYNASTKEIEAGYFYQYDAPGTAREYGLMTDAETTDFNENFDTYNYETDLIDETNYYVDIRAEQGTAHAHFFLFLPAGTNTITPGTYPFVDSLDPNTAYRGYGVNEENNIMGSFFGYSNNNGYLSIPVWYPRSGIVSVGSDGAITVYATNSYGRTIISQLGAPKGFGIEQTTGEKTATRKIVRDGQILILRNGNTYTVQGVKVND